MENKTPLISVLVACYNNQRYIKECLISIFQQSYPNIEIIVGDDGSKDFDEAGLSEWIEQNRTPNITHLTILASKENRGTVANIEHMQQESSGEYLFNIAADDTLYDENVLEALYEKAIETDSELVIAQTEMWDEELKNKIGDFLSKEDIEFIKNSTAQQIFEECCCRALLPASHLYKKAILDKLGTFSEQYRLVEDYPFQLRATRLGVKPIYSDIQSSIKHRDGGISHGHREHTSRTVLIYYRDCIWSYINEVLPYEDLIGKNARNRARKLYNYNLRVYNTIYYPDYLKGRGVSFDASSQEEILKVPEYTLSFMDYIFSSIDKIKAIVKKLSNRNAIFKTSSVTAIFFIFAYLAARFAPQTRVVILTQFFVAVGAILVVCQLLLMILLKLRRRYRNKLK